jgi:hypothetical protein
MVFCVKAQKLEYTKPGFVRVCNLASDIKGGTLTVFKNRVMRGIFRLGRDELGRNELTGGWRKLHTEELHNLYSSPSIIRRSSQGG